MNLPLPEAFGAQPPLELLRQLRVQNGWYARQDWTLTTVEDVEVRRAPAAKKMPGCRFSVSSFLSLLCFFRYYSIIQKFKICHVAEICVQVLTAMCPSVGVGGRTPLPQRVQYLLPSVSLSARSLHHRETR